MKQKEQLAAQEQKLEELTLKICLLYTSDGKERIRRDGFSHRADLVDAFLRAGLVVFQQVLHAAVALRVPGFLIPGVLGLHMAAVMLIVVHPLNFLKAEIRLLRVLPELMGGKVKNYLQGCYIGKIYFK